MGRGRAPCCDKTKVKTGAWSPEEDSRLVSFIHSHGHPNWRALPSQAGLLRCGKSCRLRWINYLRPNVKRGNLTQEEEEMVIKLHQSLGNKWSRIASCLPGRTDNEIKNIWNTHLKKKLAKTDQSQAQTPSSSSSTPSSSSSSSSYSRSSSMLSISSSSNHELPHEEEEEEEEEDIEKKTLAHSCSFSSSNENNHVGPNDHGGLKEWLRCLENELGLGHDNEQEEEEAFNAGGGDHLLLVQNMDQIANQQHGLEDNISSSWQVLFSSLPNSFPF